MCNAALLLCGRVLEAVHGKDDVVPVVPDVAGRGEHVFLLPPHRRNVTIYVVLVFFVQYCVIVYSIAHSL